MYIGVEQPDEIAFSDDDFEYDWNDEAVQDERDEREERAHSAEMNISPSEFTEFAFYMPQRGEYSRFSFDGRPYLRKVYDTTYNRRIVLAGRQVEKSTTLGNQVISYSCLNRGFRSLYVSPSNTQTKEFSKTRIQEPIETSPFLKTFTNQRLTSNVLEKAFVTRSKLTLRFAFLNADRVRGIPADYILIDEFQDIHLDSVPVIEECASHSDYKYFMYSGTPKSLDNPIEYYHSKHSTQNEWAIPCDRHGTPKDPSSWHWNIPTEDIIGKDGLICDRCGERIRADHPAAQWAALNPNPSVPIPYEGFRIPQIIVPWLAWDELLDKREKYPRAQFFNEVLGYSFDGGTRPLTRIDLQKNCNPRLSMRLAEEIAEKYKGSVPFFMGVDWGTGEGSYTVVSIGAYLPFDPNHFSIIYMHRFEGAEADTGRTMAEIHRLKTVFNIKHFGVDYGGGQWPNDELVREYGHGQVHKFQYVGNVKFKMKYDQTLARYVCHRTEIMSDIINAIKRGNIFRFPCWEEFHDPFATDCLNIFSEYHDGMRMNVYHKSPGMPDDSLHSILYCFLASMYHRKRPDVIKPQKQVNQKREDDYE